MWLFDLDVDECATDMDNCAQQATCTDTEGSFTCTCNTGYTGDGMTCTGIYVCPTDYIIIIKQYIFRYQ